MKFLKQTIVALSLLVLCVTTYAGEALRTDKDKYFKKMKGVAHVAQFNVSYATADWKTASAYKDKWKKLDGASSSTLAVRTEGLNDELFQKITDEAWTDFKNKLEEKNITVKTPDFTEGVSKYTKNVLGKFMTSGIKDNQSPYEAFGNVTSRTVPATGFTAVVPDRQNQFGLAGKELGFPALNINYLVHFGYLDPSKSKAKNDFMKSTSLKTGVKFHEGVSVYWNSGADIWPKHNRVGFIRINEHVYVAEPVGKLEIVKSDQFEGFRASSSNMALLLTVDPDKYYKDALDVLKRSNTLIIDAIAKKQ